MEPDIHEMHNKKVTAVPQNRHPNDERLGGTLWSSGDRWLIIAQDVTHYSNNPATTTAAIARKPAVRGDGAQHFENKPHNFGIRSLDDQEHKR
ncbi:hypothetical protein KIN20_004618 [Parelaphostrongylus tenuis]|uniref:Uncharacterized protein n=1 Tax=Parelaphostrongylus tenuis TaxID=148309 RepID=A0AAD5LZ30_PARTN|nr:hypothetical protein KIN20_004618 [Parelaphostrongylus tenuis]